MMIDILLLCIGVFGLVIAAIADIKTREVPDLLSYSLISLGLLLWLVKSVVLWDSSFFLYGLIGFGVMFIMGIAMFYTGQWGGGDSKILMGLGAIFPVYPAILSHTFSPYFGFAFFNGGAPFIVIFLLNIMIFGALYGFVWSLVLGLKNRKKLSEKIGVLLGKKPMLMIRIMILGITLMTFVLILFYRTQESFILGGLVLLVCSTFYVWVFVKAVEEVCMFQRINPNKLTEGDWIAEDVFSKERILIKANRVLSKKDIQIIEKEEKKINFKVKIKRISFSIKLSPKLSLSDEKERLVNISDLRKGDVLLENIKLGTNKINKNKIVNKEVLEKIKEYMKNNTFVDVFIEKKIIMFKTKKRILFKELVEGNNIISDIKLVDYIAGPKDLGASKEQIEKLIDLNKKKKIKDILIKVGIPFVPSFLIALVFTFIWGNVIFALF